ncbi:hypothetical protein SCHPADRAFT_398585 [Schizopora paradoxa]|uniref:Uncharacterized protein n=1 Tax=Schizopora paradoxa TaxID=27342 RepID=A0A0H2RLI4_9AGAM|nr:hypothetical protein SCHPADRAFT_398585 [Schizopora paradoxa]
MHKQNFWSGGRQRREFETCLWKEQMTRLSVRPSGICRDIFCVDERKIGLDPSKNVRRYQKTSTDAVDTFLVRQLTTQAVDPLFAGFLCTASSSNQRCISCSLHIRVATKIAAVVLRLLVTITIPRWLSSSSPCSNANFTGLNRVNYLGPGSTTSPALFVKSSRCFCRLTLLCFITRLVLAASASRRSSRGFSLSSIAFTSFFQLCSSEKLKARGRSFGNYLGCSRGGSQSLSRCAIKLWLYLGLVFCSRRTMDPRRPPGLVQSVYFFAETHRALVLPILPCSLGLKNLYTTGSLAPLLRALRDSCSCQ